MKEYVYSFERLDVWKDTLSLIKDSYKIIKKFPDEERFALSGQMRRALISVSSNIAEGSSRSSHKDQAHFYQLSYSSLMEFLSQLILSKELQYLSNEDYNSLRLQIEKISNKLNALRESRLNN